MSTIATNNLTNLPSNPTALTVGTVTAHGLSLQANNVEFMAVSATGAVTINGMVIGKTGGVQITNLAFGSLAGLANSSGSGNTFIGYQSGKTNSFGSNNTFLGSSSGANCSDSSNNTFVGFNSGTLAGAGSSSNTFVGSQAGAATTIGINQTVIGYTAAASLPSAVNEITLGNGSIATLRCQVTGITSLSDARDKSDVEDLVAGLTFIKRLRPVSFTWNTRDGAKVGIKDSGFIAQELQSAQDQFGVASILGLVNSDNPEKLEATYAKLVPVMVKAIQELSAEVNRLRDLVVG